MGYLEKIRKHFPVFEDETFILKKQRIKSNRKQLKKQAKETAMLIKEENMLKSGDNEMRSEKGEDMPRICIPSENLNRLK